MSTTDSSHVRTKLLLVVKALSVLSVDTTAGAVDWTSGGVLAALVPTLLSAMTLKEYEVPPTSPVATHVSPTMFSQAISPLMWFTVYDVTGAPPQTVGGLHKSSSDDVLWAALESCIGDGGII